MCQEDFINFGIVSDFFKNLPIDINREKNNWLNIKRYSVNKFEERKFVVQIKYEGVKHIIDLLFCLRKATSELSVEKIKLSFAYSKPLPLNTLKLADLKTLCETHIPPVNHGFLKDLK